MATPFFFFANAAMFFAALVDDRRSRLPADWAKGGRVVAAERLATTAGGLELFIKFFHCAVVLILAEPILRWVSGTGEGEAFHSAGHRCWNGQRQGE